MNILKILGSKVPSHFGGIHIYLKECLLFYLLLWGRSLFCTACLFLFFSATNE